MTSLESLVDNIKPKWGDQEETDDYEKGLSQEITTEATPEEDGSIRKTVVEYKTNENGQKVKVIKKIRMYKTKIKINKRVEDRKRWRKFGECAGVPPGPEKGITSNGDEVFLDLASKSQAAEAKPKKEVVNLGIVCRNCGKTGDHWTLKCPYKDKLIPGFTPTTGAADFDRNRDAAAAAAGLGDGKYIPPYLRSRTTGPTSGDMDAGRSRTRDESATIRVTNLSEDTKESDLSELFRTFGPISRIYLAKDKNTGLSKGFAFINFVHREDAARAIEKLSRFGYDNLILHLEWAKPSSKP